jgi:hypothetical protein
MVGAWRDERREMVAPQCGCGEVYMKPTGLGDRDHQHVKGDVIYVLGWKCSPVTRSSLTRVRIRSAFHTWYCTCTFGIQISASLLTRVILRQGNRYTQLKTN